jgi:hypothetical protein
LNIEKNFLYWFCSFCNILFNNGCTHAVNGCTDNVYFGKFITKCEINGKIYNGVIKYDNIIEYLESIENMKIIEETCLCKKYSQNICEKALYYNYGYDNFCN